MKRHVLRVAVSTVLAVLMLAYPGARPARAQSAGANSSSKGNAAATPKAASNHGSRGLTTGIKVHGHWTIETRNPDG